MHQALVTGGLGFIGSHLVRDILDHEKNRATVVDDLSGTVMPAADIIEAITKDRPGTLEVHRTSFEEYCKTDQPVFDYVYHLASVVGPAGVLDHAGYIAESILKNTYL